MTKSAAEHLYQAGARLARTGGSRRVLATWIADNRIPVRDRVHVLAGFGEERAQMLMAGGASARSGRPFGRL